MSNKMLVFIKGKPRPALLENIASYHVGFGGELVCTFEDSSVVIFADGQWREVDVEGMKKSPILPTQDAPVVIQDRQVPVEQADGSPE